MERCAAERLLLLAAAEVVGRESALVSASVATSDERTCTLAVSMSEPRAYCRGRTNTRAPLERAADLTLQQSRLTRSDEYTYSYLRLESTIFIKLVFSP